MLYTNAENFGENALVDSFIERETREQ